MKSSTGLMPGTLVTLMGLAAVAVAQTPAERSVPTSRPSHAQEFKVASVEGTHQVSVRSHSTLGSFTSVSNQVTGRFRFDRQHPETFAGRGSLPLTSIHTGIRARDHDLRSAKWFDAANYPDVVIAISQAEHVRRESASSMRMTLIGTCSMHGVTQPVRIPMSVTDQTATDASGDAVSIQAQFEFRLSDYQVKGTRPFGMKVDDIQRVNVSIYALGEPAASSQPSR